MDVDTSILVAHFRRDLAVTERLKDADIFYVPLTVVGELYFGAYRSSDPVPALHHLQAFLSEAAVLHPDDSTAQEYGRIKGELSQRGMRIPDNDIWIAATALRHSLPLAARDEHFARVQNLEILPW